MDENLRKLFEGRTEAFRWAWSPDSEVKKDAKWTDTTVDNHDAAHLYLTDTFNKLALHEHLGVTVGGEAEKVKEDGDGNTVAAYRPTPIGYLAQALACGMFHMTAKAIPTFGMVAAMEGDKMSSFYLDTVAVGIKLGMAIARGEVDDWYGRFNSLKGVEWVIAEDTEEGAADEDDKSE